MNKQNFLNIEKLFEETRKIKRKIIFHYGPTNSGKTFSALQELKKAQNGIYCAPLRLLAKEIFDKLSQEKIPCSLKTGEESVQNPDSRVLSCTIECCKLDKNYDIALIDEIQMIQDQERGSAWTEAFLGLKAQTIHVCGEERSLELIKHLTELCNDNLEIQGYKRRGQLLSMKKATNIYRNLNPRDCIIAFNVFKLKELQKTINEIYGKGKNVCAIIYGNLPAQVKRNQAMKFNMQKEKKYLVATNAVGLGLNLNIRRIIFSELIKPSQIKETKLTNYEILQISGRAGRNKNIGYVGAFYQKDLERIQQVLKAKTFYYVDYIKKAGFFPTFEQLENFFDIYKLVDQQQITFAKKFIQFSQVLLLRDCFFLERYNEFCQALNILEEFQLPYQDQYIFAMAPLRIKSNKSIVKISFRDFASQFSQTTIVKLPNIFDNEQILQSDTLLFLEELYQSFSNYQFWACIFGYITSILLRSWKQKKLYN